MSTAPHERPEDSYAPHIVGEVNTFKPNPTEALRLEIVIDNVDRDEYPEVPWTLNAALTDPVTNAAGPDLMLGGEGSLIWGTIPEQLRELADMIEKGEVTL